MERGERLTTYAIIGFIAVVSMIGAANLLSPTGELMQGQQVYNIAYPQVLQCTTQPAIYLGYQMNYGIYCCPEDMIGQNECRFPKRILLTR